VDISGEVGQGFIDAMGAGLAVDHPRDIPYRFGHEHPGKLPPSQADEGGPEKIGQGAYRHEIGLSRLKPVSVIVGDPPCRYETVDMGVVDQSPRPGVKDRKHADLPSHIAGIGSQFHQ